jgi:diadenosine tetraphosphatase ApaH/serine/threonine PP2A family protein phosphatase
MRLALLADVHANLEALEACVAHARAAGANRLAFLGDLVGYGADPVAVLDTVAVEVARGALAVLGNHDHAALEGSADAMHEDARRAVLWTRARLEARHRAFLAALPLVHAEGDLLLAHASAEAPGEWPYLNRSLAAERCLAAAPGARYVCCGHVHDPVLFYTSAAARPVPFRPTPGVAIPVGGHRRWLAIPGAAGQPRDGNPAASYAILDTEARALTFFRVPYDVVAAAAKVRAAGLPDALARRLEQGE